MADIDAGAPRRAEAGDRGQMILVTGIVLAVLFVALALLVNAAIYTDNVATRGGDSAGEALEYQAGVVDSVSALLAAEHATEDDTMPDDIEPAIETIGDRQLEYHLGRGAGTETSVGAIREGRLIREDGVEEFANWQADASAVGRFGMDLDPDHMTDGEPFGIDLDGTELRVNKSGGDIAVERPGGDVECAVSAGSGTVHFNVTGERLDGEECSYTFPAFGSGSEIGISDGARGGGSYELVIESDDDDIADPPETTDIIYSVELDLRIDTPELSYERTVRIAPGESDV